MKKYRIKREYHNNGQVCIERHYISKGYILIKGFFDNGIQQSSEIYINRKLHGMRQYWNSDETRWYIQQWKNHQIHGPLITFNYGN